jgi:RHS repeat-associated protein
MSMPGRKYEAQSGYRYGFNGKETENSISSNSYDFGARLFNTKIGRWFSPDKIEIAGWQTYHFCLNNPIRFKDINGNVQKDPNGSIIFSPIKWVPYLSSAEANYVKLIIAQNDENRFKQAVVEIGYIYTDKGTPVKAYRVIGYYQRGYSFVKNKEGGQEQARFDEFVPVETSKGIKSNCYGNSVANGQFYIPDTEGLETFLKDEYKVMKTGNISKSAKFQEGDILKIGEDHYIKAIGKNNKGVTIWSSDFALDEEKTGTLDEVLADLENTYGKLEGQIFTLKNAKHWRKNGKDLIRPKDKPAIALVLNIQSPIDKPKDEYQVLQDQEHAEQEAKQRSN